MVFEVVAIANNFEGLNWEMKVFALIGDDSGWQNVNESLSWSKNNIFNELTLILIIIGGLLVAFSKTKQEDEYISKIRMESLIWATYVNYGVLLFTVLFIYGMPFFNVMIYNMFTVLIFFILRFHFMLYKSKRQLRYEE
jgi:hypothetical protein